MLAQGLDLVQHRSKVRGLEVSRAPTVGELIANFWASGRLFFILGPTATPWTSLREIHSAHHGLKARLRTHGIEGWITPQPDHPARSRRVGLLQPGDCLVLLSQQSIEPRNPISSLAHCGTLHVALKRCLQKAPESRGSVCFSDSAGQCWI